MMVSSCNSYVLFPFVNAIIQCFVQRASEQGDAVVIIGLKPSKLTDDFVAHEGEDEEDDGRSRHSIILNVVL